MIFDKLILKDNISYIINKKDVLSLLGYKRGKTKISKDFAEKLDEILKLTYENGKGKGSYIIRKIKDIKDYDISFENTNLKLKSKNLSKLFEDSFAVIFFGITIGSWIEDRIKELNENKKMNEALIYDAVGSEAVEGAANSINHFFDIEARQNRYSLTKRYSPGYGDLDISVQKQLYEELELEKIGVKITDTNLLLPQKTITAFIGVER